MAVDTMCSSSLTAIHLACHSIQHGVGDPLEIAGLTRAFMACARKQDNVAAGLASGWCAIGSVKSNIGHAESASGIAAVTKVLLQMRYGQLVPSLHAEVLNPYIDFSTTPFVVQRELSEWKRPMSKGKEVARRAGVSSFGAGGSNAHVILEEYVERPRTSDGRKKGPSLIVLSAHTEEQLHEQVRQLLTWMQEEMCAERASELALHVSDVAYTLQVGREAMEERLALLVSSLAKLEEKLRKYLQGPQETADCYRGQVKRYKETVALLNADQEWQETIGKWLQHDKYEKLLEWWWEIARSFGYPMQAISGESVKV